MATLFNVTFAASDPGRLARFWAEVFGYSIVEESDDLSRIRPAAGTAGPDVLFLPADHRPDGSVLHLDLAAADVRDEVVRLLQIGATLVDPPDIGGAPSWREANGIQWIVLRDPEGNEFCVGDLADERDRQRP